MSDLFYRLWCKDRRPESPNLLLRSVLAMTPLTARMRLSPLDAREELDFHNPKRSLCRLVFLQLDGDLEMRAAAHENSYGDPDLAKLFGRRSSFLSPQNLRCIHSNK